MKSTLKLVLILTIILGITPRTQAVNFSLAESGSGGSLQPDNSGHGGLPSAWAYFFNRPPGCVSSGDLLIYEDASHTVLSDIIRFNGNAIGAQIFVYSGDVGGGNPADTGFPTGRYANQVSVTEYELIPGVLGYSYTPSAGQPGFVDTFCPFNLNLPPYPVTYIFTTSPVLQPWIVYDDALQNGWLDYSFNCTRSFANTSPVHSSNDSISVTVTNAFGGAQFHQTSFTNTAFASISFWINGGAAGGQHLQMYGVLGGVNQAPRFTLGTLSANTWTNFVVPLTALGVANKTNFDAFVIQDRDGTAQPVFYLDDIQLNYGQPPQVTVMPASTNITYGQSVTLTGSATGASPLAYQWYDYQTNAIIWGTNASVTLTNPPPAASGNYTLIVTNAFGRATNLVAVTVNKASLIITANNRTNECGTAFSFAGTEFTKNGLFSPDTVTSVTLTNNFGSNILATNAVGSGLANYNITYVAGVLTTVDTTPPVITLLGANPFTNLVNVVFVEPGASALDACGGSFAVTTNITVNVAVPGIYTNTFTSTDSYGNIASVTRTVVVTSNIATNPPVLTALTQLGNGAFQFSFTNLTGASFTVFASTNVALPFNAWSNLGPALETPASSGNYQFTDPQATNNVVRFYRVRSP